ncbi:hypothetical protein EDB89DRAFT_1882102 [Lactarius sanguifluus]|nr:hypothetical protein EDB89DRAFT_1882102 [Lactarius sanguifluus]
MVPLAVELSWSAEFIGHLPLVALETHVHDQMKLVETYARHCAIVQSSGMGKSRLLDEFSKKNFMIPINLRRRCPRCFPPADDTVRDFLTHVDKKNKTMHVLSHSRANHFFHALFLTTAGVVAGFQVSNRAERIQYFRAFMSEGQSMSSSGPKRSQFYKDVIAKATKVRHTVLKFLNFFLKCQLPKGLAGADPSSADLKAALEELRRRLNDGDSVKMDEGLPDVFVAFDEAHQLTIPFDESDQSNFVELQRALQTFLTAPLFTFFLSTTGKISQFTPPRGYDNSNRMDDSRLKIPRPFIYLGFDQLMISRKILDTYRTLQDVTSLDCIAHMGRPLWGTCYDFGDDQVRDGLIHFAIQKLLCRVPMPGETLSEAQKCAVLSQRLALDINSTLYVTAPLDYQEAEKLHNQISNHMRICEAIEIGTIRGAAASEPLLSEAASCIMRGGYGFSLPDALIEVLGRFCINPSDRAELLVAAFFIRARDIAVLGKSLPPGGLSFCFSVTDLLSSLFCESAYEVVSKAVPSLCHVETTQLTLGEVFDDAMMHFNHFIKLQEQKLLARPYLLAFMSRGAAALGANCQPGVDAVYPYLYGGTDLDVKKIGFIMVQVKKNDSSSEEAQAEIFRKMDPFDCGLVTGPDFYFPIPIIRIVFALNGKENKDLGVTRKTYTSPSDGALSTDRGGRPRFTSYDFWCSGIYPNIFQAVEEAPERWRALLDDVDPWRKFYNGARFPDVLRSQFPACGSSEAHFNSWYADIPST